jgi:hypothetical protein
MGTSASSKGPGPGVPFDPPWLDEIIPPDISGDMPPISPGDEVMPDNEIAHDDGITEPIQYLLFSSPKQPEQHIAPKHRFTGARRALGVFAKTRKQDDFRKAAGNYSKTGMGGARNLARRLQTATTTGAHVFEILNSAREKNNPVINEWVSSLSNRDASVYEIANEIIRYTIPAGGSQDEVACQESMNQALQDLIAEDKTIDLLNLNNERIWKLIESFIGYEAFSRLSLDIGGHLFENPELTIRECVERMNEVRNYLKADISAQIERARENLTNVTTNRLKTIFQNAIENTFKVYEEVI